MNRNRTYQILLGLMTSGAATLSTGHAAIVDASNVVPTPAGSLSRVDAGVANYQTFTIENSGQLTGVRVQLSNQGFFPDAADTVVASILGLDSLENPDPSTVLATTSRVIDFDNAAFDVEFFQFDFSVPLNVEVGDRFALEIGSPEEDGTGAFWGHSGNTYLGGDAYFNTTTGANTTRDFGFQILVDGDLGAEVPLPGAAVLFAPALLGGLALRRRR